MASTSRASREGVEDTEMFQVLEEKINLTTRPSTRGISCTTTYRKFLGKMASFSFRQFFQLHKSYEIVIGTRNVQLWHYKGKYK